MNSSRRREAPGPALKSTRLLSAPVSIPTLSLFFVSFLVATPLSVLLSRPMSHRIVRAACVLVQPTAPSGTYATAFRVENLRAP